jgi:NAD(P)-dependent dehydrogenase (short-subunit alcohol dehydrogenase family)
MARLDGKVALITGGTTGIGAATARLFRNEGARVLVTGASKARLEPARADLPGIEVVLCDQADPQATRALADDLAARYGRIDVLFVNAGIAEFAPLEELTEEAFDRLFDVNVRGALFAAKAAAPHIPAGGSIVFTSSTLASSGMANGSVYSATKAALRSFSRSLGAELAPRGIRVNVVSPGPIETPILSKWGLDVGQVDALKADYSTRIPLGRMGKADEIASTVLFLASDATYITGEEIIAGGGLVVI